MISLLAWKINNIFVTKDHKCKPAFDCQKSFEGIAKVPNVGVEETPTKAARKGEVFRYIPFEVIICQQVIKHAVEEIEI